MAMGGRGRAALAALSFLSLYYLYSNTCVEVFRVAKHPIAIKHSASTSQQTIEDKTVSYYTMQLLQKVLWGSLALLHVFGGTYAAVPYKVQTPPLDTDWTYKVGKNPWPEHPRPQLRREDWQSLNGIWTYQGAGAASAALASPPQAQSLDQEILIPSCVESGLSGIQDLNSTNMWFARTFKVPDGWKGQTVMLNFEAVDYEATVFINGVKVGHNVGGYFRFSIDVTTHVKFGQDNKMYGVTNHSS